MKARRLFSGLCLSVLSLAATSPALGLANRVFASARSGNDANACDDVNLPCKTFAGAVTKLNPNGEVIVLDSGGYGPVFINQGVTIEAPAGVTAFVHPPATDAVSINAPGATVTLRGLVLNVGFNDGIHVTSVGTLNVENCFITGFVANGIRWLSPGGKLNLKGTDIKGCFTGVGIFPSSGVVRVSIDHCHFDGNSEGVRQQTTAPGSTTTTASYSTASSNSNNGWVCGPASNGQDVLNLEFCTGSENGIDGLFSSSANASTEARYSNCVFANNGSYGVHNQGSAGTVVTRGNNTITGNGTAPTFGTIGTFPPM